MCRKEGIHHNDPLKVVFLAQKIGYDYLRSNCVDASNKSLRCASLTKV